MLINLIIRYLKLKLFIRIWIFILEMKFTRMGHTETVYCGAKQLKKTEYTIYVEEN